MTITTQEALVPDSGRVGNDSTWLEIDGPASRTVFAGRAVEHRVSDVDGAVREAPGDRPSDSVTRAMSSVKPSVRPRIARSGAAGAGSAVACVGSSGPSLHGARLTRRGRVLVVVAWLILAAVAAVPVINAIADGGTSASGSAPADTAVVGVAPGDTLWDVALG